MTRVIIVIECFNDRPGEYPKVFYGDGCVSLKYDTFVDELKDRVPEMKLDGLEEYIQSTGMRREDGWKVASLPTINEFYLFFFKNPGQLDSIEKLTVL